MKDLLRVDVNNTYIDTISESNFDPSSFDGEKNYYRLEDYLANKEDLNNATPVTIDTDVLKENFSKDLKLQIEELDDDSGMVSELPPYLFCDAVQKYENFTYYPLDGDLAGYSKGDVSTISDGLFEIRHSQGSVGSSKPGKSVLHLGLPTSITDVSNDPLFTPEGLCTSSTSGELISQSKNLFSLDSFRVSDGSMLLDISQKKVLYPKNSLDESQINFPDYTQNIALSDETLVIQSLSDSPATLTCGELSLQGSKTYSISFYIKTQGTFLSGGNIEVSLVNSESKMRVMNPVEACTYRGFYSGNIYQTTDKSIASGGVVQLPISNKWERYYTTFKLPDTASYNFQIKLPAMTAGSFENTYTMICGLLAEEADCPSAYDKRKHSFDTNTVDHYDHIKAFTSIVSLDDINEDTFSFIGNNWLLTYKRRIISPLANTNHLDTLGTNISWGFKGGKRYFFGEESAEVSLSEVENKTEHVAVYKIGDTLYCKGYIDGENIYTANCVLGTISDSDFDICYCEDGAAHSKEDEVAHRLNLQLGGDGYYNRTNGMMYPHNRYSAIYRDLLFIKNIDDSEIDGLIESIVTSELGFSLKNESLVLLANDIKEG